MLTDGGDEGGVEGVLREAEQGAGLAHARVADQQQLEQVVVGLRHVCGQRPRPPHAHWPSPAESARSRHAIGGRP